MKNLTVRLDELGHKRLAEAAIKKGGTVSDSVREIVSRFFEEEVKNKNDSDEHKKTRLVINQIDDAVGNLAEEIGSIKNQISGLGQILGQIIGSKSLKKGDEK